ncbi:phosphopantetheine-binding protein [Longivirga aurantiaca]|uniref:Phosphopantetheine-binding protein n=1 Tax=Longivirga aurantiaca TaxID=1837743 RepID=A0ABW1T1W0_9ACTN
MTTENLSLAARALAVVLDLEAVDLRADSPLDDLGADSIARVQWADVVEQLAAGDGRPVTVDDSALRDAVVLGDLADHLVPVGAAGGSA